MSGKENGNKEKVVTKYDLKVERRKAAKEQERKSRMRTTAITVVVVIAIVAWIASYPILNYVHKNESWIKVNGADISREEFDYYYSNAVNSFLSSYGSYASYFGLDVNSDLATQQYSDTLTWKDYFEEEAVNNLKTYKGILADASSAGFVYDTASDVEKFHESLQENAKEAGVSAREYLKSRYGAYATLSDIKKYIAENAYIAAYVDEKSEDFKPSDEEVQAYYDENKASYDSVDYYIESFEAEIPAEDPTDEQIEAAMNQASAEANEALSTLTQSGNLMVNETKASISYPYSDWLFDDSRKEGDQTVVEDTDSHAYYAIRFVKRYLNEETTANVYAIISEDNNGQEILDEWNAGEATVERFQELVKKYDSNGSADGYYENIVPGNLESEAEAWLSDAARQIGDVTLITPESSDVSYVFYYAGQGEVSWKASIISTLSSQNESAYEEKISEGITVVDEKGHLNYLKVEAEQDEQAEQSGQDEQAEQNGQNEETEQTVMQ